MNVMMESEVIKLRKELEQVRGPRGEGGQLTSLQAELEKLRAELQEAHAVRKKMEEEHGSEKMTLEQVSVKSVRSLTCSSHFL